MPAALSGVAPEGPPRAALGAAALVALAIVAAGCADRPAPDAAASHLVVLIVVDQLIPERLDPGLPGGLGRLAREGRVFGQTYLDHAHTETCPGHVSVVAGRHPGPAGIPGNSFFSAERDRLVYCVEDADPAAGTLGGASGRSPRNLRVSTLGDWLKQRSPGSRVFTVAGKDRAGILLAGAQADAAYWFDLEAARFTTSRFYRDALPDWLARWQGSDPLQGLLARLPERWDHLPEAAAAEQPDDFPGESQERGRVSGHPLRASDLPTTVQNLVSSPHLDELTLELASELVRAERLGADRHPDLLGVGLSATDLIGHLYGPQSHEARDALLRLDAALGRLLDELEQALGGRRPLVVLTSDHGVLPLPEWETAQGRNRCPVAGGRLDGRRMVREVGEALTRAFGPLPEGSPPWLLLYGARIAVNRAVAAERGVDPAEVAAVTRRVLEGQPGIERVWTASEIASGAGPEPWARLYRNSYDAERSGDLELQWQEGCLLHPLPTGTSHGSPYAYDRHVPLVVWGPGIEPGLDERPVATVDIAPTLAVLLGIPVPSGLDGRGLELPRP
jgi:predicted AlkP superfamily pyrophosphatase or phosphodiesterase